MNKKMLVKVDGVVMTWEEALNIQKELIQTVIPGSFRVSRHAMPEFVSTDENKEEEKMAKEMLKAWNLEDGVGMVGMAKLRTLTKLNKKAMKMQKKGKPVSLEALEAKVVSALNGNGVKVKEISTLRLPLANKDGNSFVTAKFIARRAKELIPASRQLVQIYTGYGHERFREYFSRHSIPVSPQLFRHPLCDIDKVRSGYTVKQIMNLLMECNEIISKHNNTVIDLAFNNR